MTLYRQIKALTDYFVEFIEFLGDDWRNLIIFVETIKMKIR